MNQTDVSIRVVDEVMAEIWRHKEAIAAEHDCDVDLLLRSLKERQTGDPRIVCPRKGEQSHRADGDSAGS